MDCADFGRTIEVCNRSGHAKDPSRGSYTQSKSGDASTEHVFGLLVGEPTHPTKRRSFEVSVEPVLACELRSPRGLDPAPYCGAGFSLRGVAAHLLPRHGLDVDSQVESIPKRAGQSLLIPLDQQGGAAARLDGIARESARAGVHGAHEQNARREDHRARRSGNVHGALFERLSKTLQNTPS